MMSMKKTVVAIATVAVAQTTGVQANCCMSCPCSEDVAPINDPKKEVEKPVEPTPTPVQPKEQTPTPVQPEEPTRMQKCKNAVNARVADCKKGAENCKDRMVNGAETCKNGVKSGVESTKTGVKSAFRKVAAAPKQVKDFAMENPKKCITYSAITVATTAAACLKGNEALAFLRPHLATCSTELQNVMDKVQTPEWFKTVKTSVSKCFNNTVKGFKTTVKGEEEKLFSETRAWFNNFFNNLTNDESTVKKALNTAESTVKSALNNGAQKFETVSKHVPYTTNTKVQKAVTGVAAAATVAGAGVATKKVAPVARAAKDAVVNNVVTPVSNFAGKAVDGTKNVCNTVVVEPAQNAVAGVQSLAGKASKNCGKLAQKAKDLVQRT